MITTPSDFYLDKLYNVTKPLVCASSPETNWLPLMRMLRNKGAHLGQPFFRQIGLPRKGDGTLFAFIPRQWPYIWEQLIKPVGQGDRNSFPQLLQDTLIHQDIVTFAKGLVAKVESVIDAILTVLNETYDQFRDFPENIAALNQLKSNFEDFEFENFTNV